MAFTIMTIQRMARNVKQIKRDLRKLGGEVVNETKSEYLDLNIDQMRHGLNAKGQKIGEYRSDEYAAFKHDKNPLAGYGNVDLILEGDYTRYMDLKANSISIKVTSSDTKARALEGEYGTEHYGLSDANIPIYRGNTCYPNLIPKVKNILYAGK